MCKILLVLCIVFGCVFGSEITLESLQDRLVILEQQEKSTIANLTAHGLDFVAYGLEGHTNKVWPNNLTEISPELYPMVSKSMEAYSGYLKDPLAYPPLKDQLRKSDGLYFAAMRLVDDDTGNATMIKEQVVNIINAEILFVIAHIKNSSNSKMEWLKVEENYEKLNQMVNHDELLTIWDFFRLEREVKARLLTMGKRPEASQMESMLNKFLEINARIHRAIPIELNVNGIPIRLRQYYDWAPEHYRQYKALKAIL